MSPSPEQLTSQRREALAEANRIRIGRARLLREKLRNVKTRREAFDNLADMIEGEEELIDTIPVSSLLRQCYRCGFSTAHKIVNEVGLTSTITPKLLSDRSRAELVARIRS